MRIITGKARGARLTTLAGEATRPTSEKVKEAIFSAIQFDIGDRTVLDLFGGSGQMALEALSRGASSAVIVDNSRAATEVIRNNAAKTKLLPDCRIVTADWKDYLRMADGKQRFSLVFLDLLWLEFCSKIASFDFFPFLHFQLKLTPNRR